MCVCVCVCVDFIAGFHLDMEVRWFPSLTTKENTTHTTKRPIPPDVSVCVCVCVCVCVLVSDLQKLLSTINCQL